eukprot:SAG11_NODE_1507_length_4776_cov_55.272611_5_plen_123_part_00
MPTHLDSLPDDLYRKIFEHVHRPTLQVAAIKGKRRQIPKVESKTNHNVIWHWMNDRPFKSLRMSTDGYELFSYNLCIGHTERATNKKVLRDWTAGGIGYCSQTTSQHVNLTRKYACRVCCGD